MVYSIKDIQERYGVGEHTVLGWIHAGLLRAVNICRVGSSRPKWRVKEEDLESFELARTHTPSQTRGRRKKQQPRERVFYK